MIRAPKIQVGDSQKNLVQEPTLDFHSSTWSIYVLSLGPVLASVPFSALGLVPGLVLASVPRS